MPKPVSVLTIVTVVVLAAAASPGAAQYLGGGTRTAHETRLADLREMSEKFVSPGRAFPAELHDWRPMEGVRSIRDVLALIAAETPLFPTMWGFGAPSWLPEPVIGPELERLGGPRPEELVAYSRMNRIVPPWSRAGDSDSQEDTRRPRPGDLFVANLRSSRVAWFDGGSGEYLGALSGGGDGELRGATGAAFGPNGDLYVGSSQNHRILRFDGTTGELTGVVVDGGELEMPFSLVFGPDGDLYVSSGSTHRVLRYDGRSGTLVGVAAEGGGLLQPIGLGFGPEDGMLYVVNSRGRNVLRFDPATGEPLGVFASDSLRFPSDLAFGPDGGLYVTSAGSGAVVRFDRRTGAFVDIYGRLPGDGGVPVGLAFRADGSLVVGDFARSRLYEIPPGGGEPLLLSDQGLAGPENVAIRP